MKNDKAIVALIDILGRIPADYGSPSKETDAYASKVFKNVMINLEALLESGNIKEEDIKDAVSKLYMDYVSSEAPYYAIRDIERKLSYQLDWLVERNHEEVLMELHGILDTLLEIENSETAEEKANAFELLAKYVNYVVENNVVKGKLAQDLVNKIKYMEKLRGNISEKDLLEIGYIINRVKNGFDEQHGLNRSEYFEQCALVRQQLMDCLGVIHDAITTLGYSENMDGFMHGANVELNAVITTIERLLFNNEKGFLPHMRREYNDFFNNEVYSRNGLLGLIDLSTMIGKHLAELHADIQQKKNEYTERLILNNKRTAKDNFMRATQDFSGVIKGELTWTNGGMKLMRKEGIGGSLGLRNIGNRSSGGRGNI